MDGCFLPSRQTWYKTKVEQEEKCHSADHHHPSLGWDANELRPRWKWRTENHSWTGWLGPLLPTQEPQHSSSLWQTQHRINESSRELWLFPVIWVSARLTEGPPFPVLTLSALLRSLRFCLSAYLSFPKVLSILMGRGWLAQRVNDMPPTPKSAVKASLRSVKFKSREASAGGTLDWLSVLKTQKKKKKVVCPWTEQGSRILRILAIACECCLVFLAHGRRDFIEKGH